MKTRLLGLALGFATILGATKDTAWFKTSELAVDLSAQHLQSQYVSELYWESDAGKFFSSLYDAKKYCAQLNARVPTIYELFSLYVQKDVVGLSSNDSYGSQTNEPGYPNHILNIDFRDGNIFIGSYAGQVVRCVR